jgi:hypothetical protein
MKIYVLMLTILVAPYFLNAQSSKTDMSGKIGITLYGGGNIPVSGNYSAGIRNPEFLNTGSQFGVGLSYYITKGFGLEGSLNAGYNYYKDKFRTAGKEPVWVNFSSSLNAIYNFGHMIRKSTVSPFIRFGAGSYQREQFEDGIVNGDISESTNNHNVKSFGFNIGAGAEYSVKKNFSIGLLLDYNMYFPKQENPNGNGNSERTGHGYFSPQLKVSYYIPTR